MDSSATGAACVLRRIICRALLVFGGSVVGTAIAWTIGSATAAAEPSCALPQVPGLSTVEFHAELVCHAELTLPPAPVAQIDVEVVAPIAPLPRITTGVTGLGRSDRPGTEHHPGGGAHEPPSLVPPVGESSAAAPAGSRPGGTAAADLIVAPPPVSPAAPVTAPAAVPLPSSGQSGSAGGPSPPMFAALPAVAGRVLPAGVPAPPLHGAAVPATRPGAQPGVTPD